MKRWFSGKTVAVIGNAKSLFDTNHGRDIDAHDVVVRINLGGLLRWNDRSHGTRLDVLAFSRHKLAKRVIRFGIECELPNIDQMLYLPTEDSGDLPEDHPASTYPRSWYSELCERLGMFSEQKPSTGLMLLDYLDRCECDSIDVYGFDWKQTPSFYNDRSKSGVHLFQLERVFCLEYFYAQRGVRFYG